MNVPIIRLEVEGMKYTILTALSQHSAQIDTDIQAAVEEYCKPSNISYIVRKAATEAFDRAIKEEVHNFFMYNGKGRKMVAEAVKEKLLGEEI